MIIIFILFLVLIIYIVVKNYSFLKGLYTAIKAQKEFSRRFQEQQDAYQSKNRENSSPQSSVDKIRDANMDLNGGEYIDYEDVREDK
ncbi:DUF4834 family protein [Porphyromonas sp.]|uniref:DUF4834 family protein n=1 Tax=Porphyromonas sp. TaxID=1924944 RepID=UPI0026DC322A|nr:DUF4834 family protein [Porphyromonas sp.]MDO4695649.1 DUF4834 family protein [Porphyromonas sp.]MDO4771622.1 DUF4834 family protein [Porphyromonas sp.]